MRSIILKRRGNALLPAIFLLLFVAIFGAVLLRSSFISITSSARISSVRQAEALAKSGTDYLCDYLCGTQGTELFKDLDKTLELLSLSAPVANIPLEINSEKLNSSITLLSRVDAGNIVTDEYIVKSTISYRGQKSTCARRMSSERVKSGLGDDKVIGTVLSSQAKEYALMGDSHGTKAKIVGPVRVENGKSFQATHYEFDGDLYVNASHGIYLTDTIINGNLYLQIEVQPANGIQLNNVTVDGDIILLTHKTNCTIFLSGTINCKNMYVNSTLLNAASSTINAENLYLGKDGLSTWLPSGFIGNIVSGQAGADAVASKQRDASNVEIQITEPSNYDIELESDNVEEFNNTIHDLTGGKTINVEAGKVISSRLVNNISVKGDGTLNVWMDKHGSSFELHHININRESDNAVINFITLNNSADVSVREKTLNANIINPFSHTVLSSARVQGVIVSESFQFYSINGASSDWGYINIDTTVGWANTGSLPGLGKGSVTYKYGKYVK